MDASFDYVQRVVPATETMIFIPGSGTPANAVVQRDGTVVTQRDGTIVVDQRP